MIDISVKVPEDRVADFYSMYGRWLDGAEDVLGPEPAEVRGWSKDDVEIARSVWAKFSPQAKTLFSTLIGQPDRKFAGEELAAILDLDGRHQVAGVFAWPSRHCAKAGRDYCWTWEYPDGETVLYSMNPSALEAFRTVYAG